jgi:hypothetical protein
LEEEQKLQIHNDDVDDEKAPKKAKHIKKEQVKEQN